MEQLKANQDFESLLCAEPECTDPLELPKQHELFGASPQFVLQSLEWFSCLFVMDVSPKVLPVDDAEMSAFDESNSH